MDVTLPASGTRSTLAGRPAGRRGRRRRRSPPAGHARARRRRRRRARRRPAGSPTELAGARPSAIARCTARVRRRRPRRRVARARRDGRRRASTPRSPRTPRRCASGACAPTTPRASAARTPAVARPGDVTVAVDASGDPAPRPRRAARAPSPSPRTPVSLPLRRRRRGRAAGSCRLVGGGPGDPGLITVRGRRAARRGGRRRRRQARAARAARRARPRRRVVVDAGKAPHAHNLTQDQINATIVEHALAGRRVVRLKGGDPYVFGRGGEEALACVAAGVPFEVVPGVTSAVAVPALRGHPGDAPRRHPGLRDRLGAPRPLPSGCDRRLGRARARARARWCCSWRWRTWSRVAPGAGQARPGRRHAGGRHQRRDHARGSGCSSRPSPRSPTDAAAAGVRPPAVVVVGDVVRLRELLAVPRERPALVGVAHGSRDPAAQATVGALLGEVRARRPDLDVRVAFVQNADARPARRAGAPPAPARSSSRCCCPAATTWPSTSGAPRRPPAPRSPARSGRTPRSRRRSTTGSPRRAPGRRRRSCWPRRARATRTRVEDVEAPGPAARARGAEAPVVAAYATGQSPDGARGRHRLARRARRAGRGGAVPAGARVTSRR